MSTTLTSIPQASKPGVPPPAEGRSGATGKLIEAQNEARRQYARDPGKEQTYCNDATFCMARRMGAPLRDLGDAHGDRYSADQIAHSLAGSTDYRDVSSEEAQQLANQGNLVSGAWFNPHDHGRVVTVAAGQAHPAPRFEPPDGHWWLAASAAEQFGFDLGRFDCDAFVMHHRMPAPNTYQFEHAITRYYRNHPRELAHPVMEVVSKLNQKWTTEQTYPVLRSK